MLYASSRLLTAYSLKKQFFLVLNSADSKSARVAPLSLGYVCPKQWPFKICRLRQYNSALVKGHLKFIRLSLHERFIKGANNKIKVL